MGQNMIARLLEYFRPKQGTYFPPILPEDWKGIGEILLQEGDTMHEKLEAASKLARRFEHFQPFSFDIGRDQISVTQDGTTIVFPAPIPDVKFYLLVSGYVRWLQRKYSIPGFCEVEPGDVVIDCGAYVGGFGLAAAQKKASVHAFEPDKSNFRCAQTNLALFSEARVVQAGLLDREDTLRLNLSASSVEHSFLAPDDGETVDQVEVHVMRIDQYCRNNAIEEIDFLKIEAEGVEIEVFDGLGELLPRKVAIDVSPERDGLSPADPLRQRLEVRGYDIKQRGHMLFGRRGHA